LINNGNDIGDVCDDAFPPLSGKGCACAYCGASDPPPQPRTWNGQAVPLHADCEEYWAREHEEEDGEPPEAESLAQPLARVSITEIRPPAIAAAPDDNLDDINPPEWRQ
jgi:hypothetical protein